MPAPSHTLPIALVEDDPLMGALVVQMLGMHDLPTDHYQSGFSFLKSSSLQDYETAILDLSLPDIDGFDLIKQLADTAPHLDLLLISGRGNATLDSARLVAEGLGHTVLATLNKPFSGQELCMALKLDAALTPSQRGPLV
jgi:DNA-binding response OmpR family regulator